MPLIFVDTDNSDPDPQKKIYSGKRAGGAADKVEAAIEKSVKKIIEKAELHDFTTAKSKDAKGYVIRLSLAKVEVVSPNTKCSMSGSIVRYPKAATLKQGGGDEMVTLGMTGSATASGTTPRSIVDCVEAITEDLVTKSLGTMRLDFAKR
ncbi:MAG: hypothetical protein U0167_08820 [bacterium]